MMLYLPGADEVQCPEDFTTCESLKEGGFVVAKVIVLKLTEERMLKGKLVKAGTRLGELVPAKRFSKSDIALCMQLGQIQIVDVETEVKKD